MGERGDSLLFLQPVEMDYLQDLEKHGVSLTEYPLVKVLDSFPLYGQKPRVKKFLTTESHPWILSLQNALESFIIHEVRLQVHPSRECLYTMHQISIGLYLV